eukprot:6067086-Lingulodinium_polyedra.AAC.1
MAQLPSPCRPMSTAAQAASPSSPAPAEPSVKTAISMTSRGLGGTTASRAMRVLWCSEAWSPMCGAGSVSPTTALH